MSMHCLSSSAHIGRSPITVRIFSSCELNNDTSKFGCCLSVWIKSTIAIVMSAIGSFTTSMTFAASCWFIFQLH
nr:MAG TPA: hypothetical protein [Caudoviricetes sp.]